MFSLNVRDHFMIAHSFRGDVFGPARAMHGATYIVDVEVRRPSLDDDNLVVDIGLASVALKDVLADLNFRNLDEHDAFAGQNTTTEFLAHAIFEQLAGKISRGDMGAAAAGLSSMRVTLHESHVAWASFEGDLPHNSA